MSIIKSPDFLRKWWKEHKNKWLLLAGAARDLLSVSGSEVDVERLFSSYRDKFGIHRHALKAATVRVLTLLRSAYTQEGKMDQKLVQAAIEYNILPFANIILWRPDHIVGKLVDGMNVLLLYNVCVYANLRADENNPPPQPPATQADRSSILIPYPDAMKTLED